MDGEQRDRVNVALAAVICGRLTGAELVHAVRGWCRARADQYGVNVTEAPPGSRSALRPELVLEHWGGDAEMLAFESEFSSPGKRSHPRERVRVAARTIRDYDLDSLKITFPDGTELSGDRITLVLRGPRRGRLRRRDVLIRGEVAGFT